MVFFFVLPKILLMAYSIPLMEKRWFHVTDITGKHFEPRHSDRIVGACSRMSPAADIRVTIKSDNILNL